MAEVKKQTMRYTDGELSLIKNTFAENDEILIAIRNYLLQLDLSPAEMELMNIIKNNNDLVSLLKKSLVPELDPKAPMNQIVDLYMNIDTKDSDPEKAYLFTIARDIVQDYLTQRLECLSGKILNENEIIISHLRSAKGKTMEESFTQLSARNAIIAHIDGRIMEFKNLSGLKNETVEETVARLTEKARKDSAK